MAHGFLLLRLDRSGDLGPPDTTPPSKVHRRGVNPMGHLVGGSAVAAKVRPAGRPCATKRLCHAAICLSVNASAVCVGMAGRQAGREKEGHARRTNDREFIGSRTRRFEGNPDKNTNGTSIQ